MKHSYLQFKRSAFLFLIASALFGKVNAQSDSLRSARTDGTQSVNGTVTYDGTGAGTGGSEGTYVGYQAGAVTTGEQNAFYGAYSGYSNTTGKWNTFLGHKSGYSHTTGDRNIFLGGIAGYNTTTGRLNVFTGYAAGYNNTTGAQNVYYGNSAGFGTTTGNYNTYVGNGVANNNLTGSNNVAFGYLAGNSNVVGNGNIFIGYRAGYKELGSNKLYISNDSTSAPLIYGDFSDKKLVFNGKIGIGTSTFPSSVGGVDVSAYKLFVKGGILAEEVRVRTSWADYVFEKNYDLNSLSEVEEFINQNGHLPNVPSANKVEKDGLNVGEMIKIQQEKIEELTLYVIEQDKELKIRNVEALRLKTELDDLKVIVSKLVEKSK
ncbi:hypothetical protein [Dyadobacter diqingensis]|uniref:hypothetical protein n=1 Tax=Dyadobacter diqingensis TaxID=2938121 RepID=UPI0020C198EB|nr:hypothetical protein [Dyadobacter diqingensis]